MTVPDLLPGVEMREPPEGVELRIATLEYEGETEEEFKANLEKGIGRAVISRLGICDSYGDVIEPGAMTRTTMDMLPNHSWNSPHPPIGAITAMPKKGVEEVVASWRLALKTTLGNEWKEWLQFSAEYGKKAIQEFSIGFRVLKSKWLSTEERKERKDSAWRLIQKLVLLECSMVVSGAMTGTEVIEMRQRKFDKAREQVIRDADPEEIAIPIGADLKKWSRMGQDFPRPHYSF